MKGGLMTTMPYGDVDYTGYTCAVCGQWVSYNTLHSCPSQWQNEPPVTRWDRMSDVRIADALERIAGALERIAE